VKIGFIFGRLNWHLAGMDGKADMLHTGAVKTTLALDNCTPPKNITNALTWGCWMKEISSLKTVGFTQHHALIKLVHANIQGDHSFSTMIFHDFSTTKNKFP